MTTLTDQQEQSIAATFDEIEKLINKIDDTDDAYSKIGALCDKGMWLTLPDTFVKSDIVPLLQFWPLPQTTKMLSKQK